MSNESAERVARRRSVMEQVIPRLGGLEYAYIWSSKMGAERAVRQLSTCRQHGGTHHFAVIAEGKGVAFSPAGRACLIGVAILPAEEGAERKQGGGRR